MGWGRRIPIPLNMCVNMDDNTSNKPDYRSDRPLTAEQISLIRQYYKERVIPQDTVGEYDDELRYKNWKIRRYDYNDVPVMEFSNLEGTWMVRVPYDCDTYNLANILIDRKEDNELIEVYLTNLMSLSMIPNGFYHQAVMMLGMAYIHPRLLSKTVVPDKMQRQYRKDWKRLMKAWMEWGKERDDMISSRDVNVDEDYWRQRSEAILRGEDEESDKLVAEAEYKRKLMDTLDELGEKNFPEKDMTE